MWRRPECPPSEQTADGLLALPLELAAAEDHVLHQPRAAGVAGGGVTLEPGLLPLPPPAGWPAELLPAQKAPQGEEGVLEGSSGPTPWSRLQGHCQSAAAGRERGDREVTGVEGGGGRGKGNKKRLHFLKGTLAVC